jgi:hypothetical protein
MAGRLVDDDPELAYAHARAARKYLPRLAVVREAMGLCAYANGSWSEALAELRASRRINGSIEHLPVMADCERGLGRPERALAIGMSPEAGNLDRAGTVEMRIVIAGARRDMGQFDAAVVSLQGFDLDPSRRDPWSVRLFYAYADSLLAAGRVDDARQWFMNAALADVDGDTDAVDRIGEIDERLSSRTPEPAALSSEARSRPKAEADAASPGGAPPLSSEPPPGEPPPGEPLPSEPLPSEPLPSEPLPREPLPREPSASDAAPSKSAPAQAEFVLVFEEPPG